MYNGDMLKKGKICITVLLLLSMMIPRVYAEEVEIDLHASNAVLISSVSGSVLYGKEADTPCDSGSMVRFMSVYTANGTDEDTITYTPKDGLSVSFGLTEGAQYAKKDLMAAVLYQGYEDCAYALGLQKDFVSSMNKSSESLGLTTSVFSNSEGTSAEGQCVSAKDVAVMATGYMHITALKDLYTGLQYTPSTLGEGVTLTREPVSYDGIIGFYDGLDSNGKYSCVMSAERNGTSLTAVVFQEESKEVAHGELIKLLDYGFANYKTITITKEQVGSKEQDGATYALSQDLSLLMPVSTDESKLQYTIEIVDGDSVNKARGYVVFTLNDEEVGRVLLDKTIEEKEVLSTKEKVLRIINYMCAGIAGIFVVLYMLRHGSNYIKPEGE